MGEITFKKAESLVCPSKIDTVSSRDGFFIRENITEIQTETENGEPLTKYQYDEAFLTPCEYEHYKNSKYETVVNEAVNSLVIRRESEIIDDYTLQLIEEGVI